MATKSERMHEILERLGSIGGVKASSVISSDGIPMLDIMPSGVDSNTFAAMVASMLGSAETALKSLGSKAFDKVIAESAEVRVIAVKAGDNAILSVMVDPNTNYGLVLLEAKKSADSIAKIINE